MDFILGCNYWASNAGTEMWRNFDKEIIRKDLEVLSSHGVKNLRVFPLWRDFQPIAPILGARVELYQYRLENGKKPQNPYFLDEEMLTKFEEFLSICKEFGITVIVGLMTGWMSGRNFIPPALYNKNPITDPLALYFGQLYVSGFVTHFKGNETILA